jgi:hypothetical protein
MKSKHRALLFFGLAQILLFSGCTQTLQEQKDTESPSQEQTVTLTLKLFNEEGQLILDESLEVEPGTNAFEAMQKIAEVEYEDYGSMGAFVKGINGIRPGQGNYLALYVNGEYANKGISSHSIEDDTLIEWKIEKIGSYGMG